MRVIQKAIDVLKEVTNDRSVILYSEELAESAKEAIQALQQLEIDEGRLSYINEHLENQINTNYTSCTQHQFESDMKGLYGWDDQEFHPTVGGIPDSGSYDADMTEGAFKGWKAGKLMERQFYKEIICKSQPIGGVVSRKYTAGENGVKLGVLVTVDQDQINEAIPIGTKLYTSPQPPVTEVPDEYIEDALRYRGWRDNMISKNRIFSKAVENSLPRDVGVNREPTSNEWDAAIDSAMWAISPQGRSIQ